MPSKPRILILIHYLEIGGAEISLIGLLNAIDKAKYDVDLFVYSHQGELMQLIPDGVNLLPEIPKYSTLERPMKEVLREGYVDIVAARLLAKIRHHIYRRTHKINGEDASIFQYVANCTTPLLPKISDTEYDLAISFLNPHNICLDKVRAKKKVAWIHTDYTKIHINKHLELPYWSGFDHIASISEAATEAFVKIFPELAPKVIEIENILSPSFVQKRANGTAEEIEPTSGVVNLLSVGRFCTAKNYDNLPFICKHLVEMGVDVRWYIIGFGGQEQLIREKIAEAGMEERVIILGKRSNPYPYIKACDIYVQPSRYEGKSVTVREAQMLYKPVVVTNYPTASSQIENGVDGVIVPMDNRACAEGIKALIDNKELQARIVEHLRTHDYGNETEVEKIYKLI
ncbi:MAG: glycosyltransferase [Rikenellaceae bacterium]|nr:glycosyltransferase [Rikenellaceae bacterium]MBQ6572422.1 glycosyltransferase [Alistipes sp.]